MQKRNLNHKNETPLHYAAKKNSKEIGELLIANGADINERDIFHQITHIVFLIKIDQDI